MTLNSKIRGLRIFWRFRAARHISRANCTEINWDRHEKLHIKHSALNVDFDGSSINFLGSRKPAGEGIKELYPRKSRYFTILGQSFVKTVADKHRNVAYHNKQSYYHRWRWKTLNFQNKGFYWFLLFLGAAHTPRMNCGEMAGDGLTVCEQELLSMLSGVSWALDQISC